jgi:hypothetical protein
MTAKQGIWHQYREVVSEATASGRWVAVLVIGLSATRLRAHTLLTCQTSVDYISQSSLSSDYLVVCPMGGFVRRLDDDREMFLSLFLSLSLSLSLSL